MRGLDLAIKEEQTKRVPVNAAKADEVDLSNALRRVAEMRWQSSSAEERKEIGRKLAAARWSKNRKKKSSKTEKS